MRVDGEPASIANRSGSSYRLDQMLEMLARGLRSSRALQEALTLKPHALRGYLAAARWLGLLTDAPEPTLSADGLAYVYAGADRADVFLRAIRARPFMAELVARRSQGDASVFELAERVRLAVAASAEGADPLDTELLVELITPLLVPSRASAEDSAQLCLPLMVAPRPKARLPVAIDTRRVFSPDVYRWMLSTLLEYGELRHTQLRAFLDAAGAPQAPIGNYVALALARGDASQSGDLLVVSPSAVANRHLAVSTLSIILSDPGWRAAYERTRLQVQDRDDRDYRSWFARIFGATTEPAAMDERLRAVLADRSLSSFPIAADAGESVTLVARSFLDVIDEPGLMIALPSSLMQLWEGVDGVNAALRRERTRAGEVALPSAAYRPTVVHGGILHPRETSPRAIADAQALRDRLVRNAPYPAMIVASLLHERGSSSPLTIRRRAGAWHLGLGASPGSPLLDGLDGFAASRGWHASRLLHAGLSADALVALLVQLRVVVEVDDALHLDDGFHQALCARTELVGRLTALLDAIAGFVQLTTKRVAAPDTRDGRD